MKIIQNINIIKFLLSLTMAGVPTFLSAKDPTYFDTPIPVQGQVELENFIATTGTVNTINTPRTEAGQGESITVVAGATATYSIDAEEAGEYRLSIRYSRTDPGSASIAITSSEIGQSNTFNLESTGSTNNYQSHIGTMTLAEGEQTLTVEFTGAVNSWNNTNANAILFRKLRVPAVDPIQIYVSTAGDDLNSGDFEAPLLTLKRALDQVKEIKVTEPDRPIEVLMMPGYHEITSTLRLDPSFSGNSRGHVTIKSFDRDNKAIIGGGRRLPVENLEVVTDAETLDRLNPSARGNVQRIQLDASWRNRFPGRLNEGMVSYNGKSLKLARFPNKGLATATRQTSDGNVFYPSPLPQGEASKWRDEFENSGDIWVTGHLEADEFEEDATVNSIASDGLVRLNNFDGLTESRRKLRIINLLYELDIPGEWYFDRNTNDFYIWPLTDDAASTEPNIRAGRNSALVDSSGVDWWAFENLIIQDVGGGGTNRSGVAHMFFLTGGTNNRFAGNIVRNSGARFAIRFSASPFLQMISNDVFDCFGTLVGSSGDVLNNPNIPSGIEILNNHIYRCYARGYNLGSFGGLGNRAANNLIHDVQGGFFGGGSDNLFELNEWYDLGFELGDWNVLYVAATYSSWGSVTRHNFVHHMIQGPQRRRTGAFRGDDGTAGLNFIGNVLYKTGTYGFVITSPGGSVRNNVVTDTFSMHLVRNLKESFLLGRPILTAEDVEDAYAAQLAADGTNKFHHLVRAEQDRGPRFWEADYFNYKYPSGFEAFATNPFYNKNLDHRDNYVSGVPRPVDGDRGTNRVEQGYEFLENEERAVAFSSNDFVDEGVLDLRFKPSFTLQEGFYEIPFDDIGLYTDEYRTSVPHKNTYRADARLRWRDRDSRSTGVLIFGDDRDNLVYRPRAFDQTVSYDLGTLNSDLRQNATLVIADTTGDYGWAPGGNRSAFNRNDITDDYERDGVRGNGPWVFERVVENGPWYAEVYFRDTIARTGINVRAENEPFENGNENFSLNADQLVIKRVSARVTDGRFSIGITGGTRAIVRIRIGSVPFGNQEHINFTRPGIFAHHDDIGTSGFAGNVFARSNGEYTLESRGMDINGSADEFYFASRSATQSNIIMSAKVDSLTNTSVSAKSGVMYRSEYTEGSPYVSTLIRPDGRAFMQWRSSTNGATQTSPLSSGGSLPRWVRVVKNGDDYTGAYSTDGVTWVDIQTVVIDIGDTNFFGLALSSNNPDEIAFSTVSEITFTDPVRENPFVEANGVVSMEAENFNIRETRDNDPVIWAFGNTDSGFLGEGYMEVPDGTGANVSYERGSQMGYNVQFTRTGTYNFYVRRRADSGASNSVYAGIGGVQSTLIDNSNSGSGLWRWVNLGTVNVNSAGLVLADVVLREDGYQIDKIVLTTGAAPTGDGPPESARLNSMAVTTPQTFVELNRSVSMEAENYHNLESRSNQPLNWEFATTVPGFLGSGYMEIQDGAAGSVPGYSDGARMIYNVDFDATGIYHVYVRRRALDGGSNSAYAGINNSAASGVDNLATSESWIWTTLGSVEVSAPGVLPVDVVLREDGYQIDKIVINSGETPSGVGSEESPQRNTDDFDTTADDDGDGLSNGFEYRYYGNTTRNADASSDFDMDGSPDVDEIIAGTDPFDESSRFRVVAASYENDAITLMWTSTPGRTYSIQMSTDLNGQQSWQTIFSGIDSEGETTSRVINSVVGREFFRIGVSN